MPDLRSKKEPEDFSFRREDTRTALGLSLTTKNILLLSNLTYSTFLGGYFS